VSAFTMPHRIYYSDKYYDANDYEYRHVILPKDIAKKLPKHKLLAEDGEII
jgi:cyclin-dependent kinase regulatory subunit CKS1